VPVGIELSGKTLGIIGMGRAGTALAERAGSLGMRVIDLGPRRDARRTHRILRRERCESASTAHCHPRPAGSSMRRRSPHFVPGHSSSNCARGGVIDREALLAALASNRLGGVGLDVPGMSPPIPAIRSIPIPRVYALPHIAGSTDEAFTRTVDIVVDNVGRWSAESRSVIASRRGREVRPGPL